MTRSTPPRAGRVLLAVALLPAVGCLCVNGPVDIGHGHPCPTPDGIPVRRLPAEVLGCPKEPTEPVPLTRLRRADAPYRVDKGDVLAVYAEDVLGVRGQIPLAANPDPAAPTPAAQGYPLTVQDDGTLVLPDVPPVPVRGLTVAEVRAAVVKAITVDKKLIVPGKERVSVELLKPRRVRVLVNRADAPPADGGGHSLTLDAGRADLLEALNRTGGLPGPGAKPEAVIRRGSGPAETLVRVPLRVRPGEPWSLTEADITLRDGDTVQVEARAIETYTVVGGLGAGTHALPPDADLRVVEAVANAGGTAPACGLVTVVRRVGCSRDIRIRVDLADALGEPRENVLIRPGDVIVLPSGEYHHAAKKKDRRLSLGMRFGRRPVPAGGCDEACE